MPNLIEIVPNSSIHDGVTPRDDLVAVHALPHNARVDNTGDFLLDLANRTGLVILSGDFFGQNETELYGRPVKAALKPYGADGFRDTARRHAAQILTLLEKYPGKKVIGLGESLGATAIDGMQEYGEEAPFDAMQLADGFNWREPGPSKLGFLTYTVLDAIIQKCRGLTPTGRAEHVHIPEYDWSAYTGPRVKPYLDNVDDLEELMRSSESHSLAFAMAMRCDLPLHLVGYTFGLSGTALALRECFEQYQGLRDFYGQEVAHPAPLKPTIERGGHSTLRLPTRVAENVLTTMGLLDAHLKNLADNPNTIPAVEQSILRVHAIGYNSGHEWAADHDRHDN